MKISIIIPIYRVEKYIERCIHSVITQTFTDYEVILVDDASPDNALQIARNLLQENNITFQTIKHSENRGLSEARNSGVKVSQGQFLMFIDSDDTLADNHVLEKFHTTIECEKVDFVTANFNMVYPENKLEKNRHIITPKDTKLTESEILKALIHSKMCVNAWGKLIDKDFFLSNKLYFARGLLVEDQLWSFQLCATAHTCCLLKDCAYNYHQMNPDAITKNTGKAFASDYCVILQKIANIMDDKINENNDNINDFLFHFRNKALEILTVPFVFDNKHNWQKYYKIIQKMYRQSTLSKHEKRFSLPANLAYFVFKERIKPYQFVGRKLYLTLVNLINRYNWEAKILR